MATISTIKQDMEVRLRDTPEIPEKINIDDPDLGKSSNANLQRQEAALAFTYRHLLWFIDRAQEKENGELSKCIRENRNLSKVKGAKNFIDDRLEDVITKSKPPIKVGDTVITAKNYPQFVDNLEFQKQLRQALEARLKPLSNVDPYVPFSGTVERAKWFGTGMAIDHGVGLVHGIVTETSMKSGTSKLLVPNKWNEAVAKKSGEIIVDVTNDKLKQSIGKTVVKETGKTIAETATRSAAMKAGLTCAGKWVARVALGASVIGWVWLAVEVGCDAKKWYGSRGANPKYKKEDSMFGLIGIQYDKVASWFSVSKGKAGKA